MNGQASLLITGANGFLGQHLCTIAADRDISFSTTYRTDGKVLSEFRPYQLDVTSQNAIDKLVRTLQPKAIINLAAINPGGPSDLMEEVNGYGAGFLARAAYENDSRFIHVSSDCVHSGKAAPYADNARPNPVNTYGRSKALGETLVMENHPQATILRSSLIYRLDQLDRGTAGFIQRLKRGEKLALFTDVIRQPIHSGLLCDAMLRLIGIPFPGTLNIAGSQVLSRAEFGRKMLDYWRYDYGEGLCTALAAEFAPDMPRDLRLDIKQAEDLLGVKLLGVDAMVLREPKRI